MLVFKTKSEITCYSSSIKVMSLKLPLSKSLFLTVLVNFDVSMHNMHMLVQHQNYLRLSYVMSLVNVSVKEKLHPEVIFSHFHLLLALIFIIFFYYISLFILKDCWTIKLGGVCIDDVMVEFDLVLRDLLSSPPIALFIRQLITSRVKSFCKSDFF